MSSIEKTASPYLANLNIANTTGQQSAESSFTAVVNNFQSEVEMGYLYHDAMVTSNPIDSEAEVFEDLNSTLQCFDENFLMYWIDKYNSCHYQVKVKVNELLGDNNVYFKDFSESLGSLVNFLWIKDRSTVSKYDADTVITDIPYPYNSTLHYILDKQTQEYSLYMSKLTGSVFNRNNRVLGEIQKMNSDGSSPVPKTVYDSTLSHGGSLAVDQQHYGRMKILAGEILTIIEQDLKGLKGALRLLKESTNNIEINKELINISVEDIKTNVSILKNKIIQTRAGLPATHVNSSEFLSVGGKSSTVPPVIPPVQTTTATVSSTQTTSEPPTSTTPPANFNGDVTPPSNNKTEPPKPETGYRSRLYSDKHASDPAKVYATYLGTRNGLAGIPMPKKQQKGFGITEEIMQEVEADIALGGPGAPGVGLIYGGHPTIGKRDDSPIGRR